MTRVAILWPAGTSLATVTPSTTVPPAIIRNATTTLSSAEMCRVWDGFMDGKFPISFSVPAGPGWLRTRIGV